METAALWNQIHIFQYGLEYLGGITKIDTDNPAFKMLMQSLKSAKIGDFVYVIENLPEGLSERYIHFGRIDFIDERGLYIACNDDYYFELNFEHLNNNDCNILVIPLRIIT